MKARMHRLAQRVAHVHVAWVAVGLAFWVIQGALWITMMVVVQLTPSLQKSILYTIQISHWALVITCGTAATATAGIITSRHRGKTSEEQHREIERDIAELAAAPPGSSEANLLSDRLRDKLGR